MKNMTKFTLSIIFVLFTIGSLVDSRPSYATETFSQFGPSGGHGGNRFNDGARRGQKVKEVKVYSGALIDSIQVVYTGQTNQTFAGKKHGGSGGNLSVLRLAADEYITTIGGKYGNLVDSLYIKTNKGQVKKWGGSGGKVKFYYNVPPGTSICGFFGRAGKYVDSIGVIMKTMKLRGRIKVRPVPVKVINELPTKNGGTLKVRPVQKSINAKGNVVLRYPDGKTIEKYRGGKTITMPNGQPQHMRYSTQAPAAIPPSLPDNAEIKWLEGHSNGLMGIIRKMVDNDSEAIQHFQQYEGSGASVYEQINKRATTINYLITP